MKLIYVAGKYTAKTHSEIDWNIRVATYASVQLWKKGWAVITPHLNTAHFEIYEDNSLGYQTWIDGDIEILKRCDAIFMLNNWAESKGAVQENSIAIERNLEVYYQEEGYPDA